MKVLIVEDENLAIKRLQKLLSEIPEPIEVLSVTKSIAETVEWLNSHAEPDIILLDIELADGQSFEIFNQVQVKSVVIFTTSYNEYALKAFQLNSIDYLLKPIEKEDLERAIRKYKGLKEITQPGTGSLNVELLLKDLHERMSSKSYRKRFLVKSGNRFISIDVNDIACFYVEGRLSFFKTFSGKKFIVDYTMEELEEMLDPSDFFRINRACFIARRSVQQIEEHLGNRLYLHTQPQIEKETIVSREKVNLFKEWMGS
ncbi:MAG: LytTR family DNA-binding domain-containing protein [Bacteroidota bacterium]